MAERKLVRETTTRAYTGSKQTPTQTKGQETKMDNFAREARTLAGNRRRGKERK